MTPRPRRSRPYSEMRFGQVRVAAVEALAHLRGARAFEILSGVLGAGATPI